MKYKGAETWVKIGDDNQLREYVTINRATGKGEVTQLGSRNLLMAYSHVAHNCFIEDEVIIANAVALAGHIYIESQARISGVLGVHQFVHIGKLAMVGGMSRIERDVPPFTIVEGNPSRVRTLNLIGLQRSGLSEQDLKQLKKAFRLTYRSSTPLQESLSQLDIFAENPYVQHFCRFLKRSSTDEHRRGLIRGKRIERERSSFMNIFISTGEVSGDLQGSMLITALRQQAEAKNIPIQISALGGERMNAAGAHLIGNTAAIGSIGILESIPFIIPTWLMQQKAKKHLRENPPDLLILIDYMGPNLSLGAFFRRHLPDIPIVYYIAPQAWVWSPGNQAIEQIVAITDKMLAIFPGAAKFFAEKGVSVDWVGHPLIDRLQEAPSRTEARKALNLPADKQVVALFPASRYQELKYLLPTICDAAQQLQSKLPELHFVIATSLPDYRKQIEAAVEATRDYGNDCQWSFFGSDGSSRPGDRQIPVLSIWNWLY